MAQGDLEVHHSATHQATMTEWLALVGAAQVGTTTFWIQICRARELAWALEVIAEQISVTSSCEIKVQ